ncbi:MAG: signal peptidase II [Coprobacillus sp.]|nr:signal peptidase II [Coprobacillus sp.]
MPKKVKEETPIETTPVESAQVSEQEVTATVKKHPKWDATWKWIFESFIWLFVLMFIIDIVTKTLIKDYVPYYYSSEGEEIWLINNFLGVKYVINDGMAFGIDTGNYTANIIVFVGISVIAAVVIITVFAVKYKKIPKFARACCMIILAGCIGNLIDRAFYTSSYLGVSGSTRGVIDWIAFHFGNYEFPTFNWADACLVVGVIMLIIWLFVWDGKQSKKEKEEKAKSEVALHQAQMDALIHGEESTNPKEEEKVEDVVVAPVETPTKETIEEKTSRGKSKS